MDLILNADNSNRDTDREVAELDGHVHVIYGDQHLVASHAVVNLRAKTVDAAGDVVITTSTATISGQRIIFDFEGNTGVIYDGFVQSGAVFFEGKIIYRLSEKEFIAEGGRYTTCNNCPESWSFSGTKIRAILGGYAYIKNSIFEFGGVPFLYLPYLIVPLKSDRQSGFLPPDFGRSPVGGLALGESYFWAMSRDQDSTFTFKNYELRGAKALYNYRYALTEHGGGELTSGYLQDAAFAEDPRYKTFANAGTKSNSVQRWFLDYKHYQELPDNFTNRVQITSVNDLQYPKDFPEELTTTYDPALEDRISISQASENIHWMIDSSYYTNLLQSNPLAGNTNAVHRLPEIRLNQTEVPVGKTGIYSKWSLDYTNFTSSGFGFNTLNSPYASGVSRFLANSGTDSNCNSVTWEQNPNCSPIHNPIYNGSTNPLLNRDLIRTGQRLDSNLEFARPVRVSNFDIVPSLSVRETDYQFNNIGANTAYRDYAQGKVTGRTVFSNDTYSVQDSTDKIKHVFQPEISYQQNLWFNQAAHPFFGANNANSPFLVQSNISDSDLNSPYGLQFDYYDRTYASKIATLTFANFLIRKHWVNDQPIYSQFLTWKLSQSFDVSQSEGNYPNQPWSDIDSEFSVNFSRFLFIQSTDYFPYNQFYNSNTRLRLISGNDFIEAGYVLTTNIVPGQPVNISGQTNQVLLTLKKSLQYLDVVARVVYDENAANSGSQYVNSYGVATQFRLPGDCWYFDFMIYRPPAGLENTIVTFNFSFDGSKRPTLPESVLDTKTF